MWERRWTPVVCTFVWPPPPTFGVGGREEELSSSLKLPKLPSALNEATKGFDRSLARGGRAARGPEEEEEEEEEDEPVAPVPLVFPEDPEPPPSPFWESKFAFCSSTLVQGRIKD